jgi:hypothetical protein
MIILTSKVSFQDEDFLYSLLNIRFDENVYED